MGIHIDSITVAPSLTLTDKEFQNEESYSRIREIGVETGAMFNSKNQNGKRLLSK